MSESVLTSIPKNIDPDEGTLSSLPKIIIKKENIGLEEYQHQKYQYNLFNHLLQHDHYYEDLCRVKDRLQKVAPNMQQVIHADMNRANTNKIYERKLIQILNGPRGLDWQCKQELQRLQNNERDIERDLMRLNRDRARIGQSSPLGQASMSHQKNEVSQIQPTYSPSNGYVNPSVQTSQKSRHVFGRSVSMQTSKASLNRLTPISQKRFSLNQPSSFSEKSMWIDKPTNSNSNEERSYLQQHAHLMDLQKQKLEEKLREFLL